jgi:hypothetical protein
LGVLSVDQLAVLLRQPFGYTPPQPSSRLPPPDGLAELKALYAAGKVTEEQFRVQVMRLLPAKPYPDEPQAPLRRKTKP